METNAGLVDPKMKVRLAELAEALAPDEERELEAAE
jgi:hypothetical protein